ncbi:glycosyltransferase [Rhodococcus hoagii]|nr:glycosyltransferase [Prescottella equi]
MKLPGHVSNDEVYRILTSGRHHVFLNTSSSESVSFSMSEALGAGLPVVGTDVVGTHEVLHDGRKRGTSPA